MITFLGRLFKPSVMKRTPLVRKLGSSSHHHSEPHVPVFHQHVGKALLVVTYLWIMYRVKQDKGQLFGLYYPWLDEHEHGPSLGFSEGDSIDAMPTIEDEEIGEEEH